MIDNTLAEAILRYVSEHKISHLMDISDEFAVKQGYGSADVKVTVDVLLEKELLALMQGRKQSVRVTDRGNKALLLGMKDYDDKRDRWDKVKLVVEWIVAIGGLIALLIGWL